MRGRSRWVAIAGAAVAGLLALPAAASAAGPYPEAIVMVSGYNSSTAFTTPDASCEGQEGDTWSNPAGPAAALRAGGNAVFTAPVKHGTDPALAPCAPGAQPVPGPGNYIDSFGANDPNGAALASFLEFLRTNYGVEHVQLVAHSDGGQWSRSAMTQDSAFSGLVVDSLTTLGTPYTGSMVADIASELNNGRCDFKNFIEQDVCEALLDVIQVVFKGMGPTTIRQLTHAYLESWNPQQSIGTCPVTTIAGTGLDL
jgi:triacylglycerol lipase